MIEVAVSATALHDDLLAVWARTFDVAVDIRSIAELGVAAGHGIPARRMVVHADTLGDDELRCATRLGVGRVVVGSLRQIDVLGAAAGGRGQGVLLRLVAPAPGVAPRPDGFTCGTKEVDNAVGAVLRRGHLVLHGFYEKAGHGAHSAYAAVIDDMVAQLDHVRRSDGVVLSRLGVEFAESVDCLIGSTPTEIDEMVDDACEAMRFPRPRVLLSLGAALTECDVARAS